MKTEGSRSQEESGNGAVAAVAGKVLDWKSRDCFTHCINVKLLPTRRRLIEWTGVAVVVLVPAYFLATLVSCNMPESELARVQKRFEKSFSASELKAWAAKMMERPIGYELTAGELELLPRLIGYAPPTAFVAMQESSNERFLSIGYFGGLVQIRLLIGSPSFSPSTEAASPRSHYRMWSDGIWIVSQSI